MGSRSFIRVLVWELSQDVCVPWNVQLKCLVDAVSRKIIIKDVEGKRGQSQHEVRHEEAGIGQHSAHGNPRGKAGMRVGG